MPTTKTKEKKPPKQPKKMTWSDSLPSPFFYQLIASAHMPSQRPSHQRLARAEQSRRDIERK